MHKLANVKEVKYHCIGRRILYKYDYFLALCNSETCVDLYPVLHIKTCIQVYIYTCTQVYISIPVHRSTYTYQYTGLNIQTSTQIYVYIPVHRPTYTYLYTGLYKGSKEKILEMLTNFKVWDSLHSLAI